MKVKNKLNDAIKAGEIVFRMLDLSIKLNPTRDIIIKGAIIIRAIERRSWIICKTIRRIRAIIRCKFIFLSI